MNYFITSQISGLTSAIELAQIKRLRLFQQLNQSAKIITRQSLNQQNSILKELQIENDVINLVDFFQNKPWSDNPELPKLDQLYPTKLLDELPSLVIKKELNDHYTLIEYKDQWGFLDQQNFYDRQQLSTTNLFTDKGKLSVKIYYNDQQQPVLTYYYRGGKNDKPILTLIKLQYHQQNYFFNNQDELMAFFLDCLVESDPEATFYSDREDYALVPFTLMKTNPAKFVILHSVFTDNAKVDGNLVPYVKKINNLPQNTINGIICSTKQEQADLQVRIPDIPIYAIPVSYEDVTPKPNIHKRKEQFQIIAIARLSDVKQLDQLILTTIKLHQLFSQVTLSIYGYQDSWNQYKETNYLTKLVQDQNAESYIFFKGYRRNLDSVYKDADVMVVTSKYEGFSMAILESLTNNCPVISYDINYGPKEMIDDNITGRLLPANDTSQLTENLQRLIEEPQILDTFRKNIVINDKLKYYSSKHVRQLWQKFLVNQNLFDYR